MEKSPRKFYWQVSQNDTAVHVKVFDATSHECTATFVARKGGTGSAIAFDNINPSVNTHQGGMKLTFRSKKS